MLLPLGVLLLLLLLLLLGVLLLFLLLLVLGILLLLLLLLLLGVLLLLLLLLLLGVLLLLLLLLPLGILLLFLLLLLLGVLLLFLLLLPLGVLLLFQLLLVLGVLLLFLLLLPLGILLLLLLLLLLSVLLLFLLLLPLGVLLLFLLLLLLGVLLLLLLLLLLGVLLLFLLLLLLGVLLLLLLLLPLGILLLLLLLLLLGVLLLLLLLLLLGILLCLLLLSGRLLLLTGYGGLRHGIRLRRALWFSANLRLNTLDPAHVHDANGRTRSRRALAHLLDLGCWKRPAGILSQRRLLPVERNRSRRRSGARYHGPAQHVGGRTRSPGRGVCPGAENALPLRRDRRSGEDLDRSKLSSRYRSRILSHPAASGEGVLRNRRDAVLNIPVHVLDVGNRRVIGIPAVVVIVVDGGVIDHRVGVVHPRKITLARLVRREIRLARTQGEPSYRRGSADGKAQAETGPPLPPPIHATSAGA